MKIRPFEHALRSLFRQQIHGEHSSDNISELVKPESQWEGAESVIEDILRWADDGGQMLGLRNRTASFNSETARERANE